MMNLHETCYEVLHGQNIIQLYLFCKLICKSLLVFDKEKHLENSEQISHVWEGICEKYQPRDKTFPDPKGGGNLVSRLVFFTNTLPNMIYLFNYTEYYLHRNTSWFQI